MMGLSRSFLATVVVAVSGFSSMAFAETAATLAATPAAASPAAPEAKACKMDEHLIQDLHLTASQQKQFQEIWGVSRSALDLAKSDLHTKIDVLHDVYAGKGSDADLKSAFADVEAAATKLASARFDTMLKVRDLLTPEQRHAFFGHLMKKDKMLHCPHHPPQHHDQDDKPMAGGVN